MSSERRPFPAVARCALPLVLVLTAAPAALSQSLNCYPIRNGESAAEVSRRVTGDTWNAYQSWFQIMDASSRFVPKSQYDRLHSGWRACIVNEARGGKQTPPQAGTVVVADRAGQEPPPALADTLGFVGVDDFARLWLADAGRLMNRVVAGVDPMKAWFGATVIVALLGWRPLDDYVGRRKTVRFVMNHFAHRFVREFERPLIQRPTEPPLKSLVRISPARGRLEILLAPGEGRRYPNLSDHRKNVEYDVGRVIRSLADDSFVPDSLHSQAGWVVVQFRFQENRKHTGAACISSF